MKKSGKWWIKAFQKGFWPLSQLMNSHDWKDKASKEILFIVKQLKLLRGASFLDLGCGIGRHSIALAQHGYRVVGIDISDIYLDEATARARKIKPKPKFLRTDIRKIGFKNEFNAAICLFTSFGYFPRKSDDILSIRRIHRALKPGGALVIDLFNGTVVKNSLGKLAQKGESFHNWRELSDGSLLL
jgi:SAM-dependent methyltransferase